MESLLRENGRGVCAQTKKAGAAWVFDGWGMAGKRSDNGAERPAALQSYRLGNYATRKCVLYTDGRGVYRKVRRCEKLFELIKDKEYFVLTTNVDHQFQKAGFDKHRLFYTQGDYGLFQCSEPCHNATYDNETVIRDMVKRQADRKRPTELIPHCLVCGRPMTMN